MHLPFKYSKMKDSWQNKSQQGTTTGSKKCHESREVWNDKDDNAWEYYDTASQNTLQGNKKHSYFLPTQLASTSLRYMRVVHVLLIVNY